MQIKPPATVQLSEAEARQVQQYADTHGLTLEEACTQLARQGIKDRFVRPKTPARIFPLPKRLH